MMSQILTLAGMKQVGAGDLGAEPQGALVTAEPGVSVGPMAAEPMPTAADSMRSVLDKLNPEPAGDDNGEELGPFQHDSEKPEGGDEPAGDDQEGPDTGAEPEFGNDQGEEDSEEAEDDEDQEETDEGQYDNSPADANSANPFDSNEFANQENQPGSGETSDGEKRQSNLPTATFEALMKEYKQFIGEGDEEKPGKEEDMDEDVTDRLKDLDPKNPVNIPAYQRKAKSGDSAQAAKNTKESVETADILKLAGLK
jgi:cobalamin biosynthesis protein CobT